MSNPWFEATAALGSLAAAIASFYAARVALKISSAQREEARKESQERRGLAAQAVAPALAHETLGVLLRLNAASAWRAASGNTSLTTYSTYLRASSNSLGTVWAPRKVG